MNSFEVNFDGLLGPSHNYAGLSLGNVASMHHAGWVSYPRQGALQCLEKMKLLMNLGIPQGVFPPHERPSFQILRALGYRGSEEAILEKIVKESPRLLQAIYSASSMWMANAATVTPAFDSYDGRVHISIANLLNRFHRSIEAEENFYLFKHIFSDASLFAIHPPLPKGGQLGDEGAANHHRFQNGVHLFVYNKSMFEEDIFKFPGRQAKEASEAIARRHGLKKSQTVFAKQNPEIVALGVFHNDVIAVGDKNVFFFHERAYVDQEKVLAEILEKCMSELQLFEVKEEEVPALLAVKTYLFNSQLFSHPNGKHILIAPKECRSLDLKRFPFEIHYVDLNQSMQNGGGPACLRLRIPLEKKSMPSSLMLTEKLYTQIKDWIEKHFREQLFFQDLIDPQFLHETKQALDEISQILKLGSIYSFQKEQIR